VTTTEDAVITATGLTKRFGATEAVRGVDLKVVAGEPVRAAFSRFILQPRGIPAATDATTSPPSTPSFTPRKRLPTSRAVITTIWSSFTYPRPIPRSAVRHRPVNPLCDLTWLTVGALDG
jgi:hypothetical protein